ncbi:cytochrome c-type biogenesis protein [Brackiella oedipodis]|uniref:cytochrome c-type biogenesis protein n=1 Tax=Brackiella oedipodis TaxID=124225 RepID=UPI000687FC0C|nr:cytochrome c-type biogenesis protein [Brackiella oedipodis]
MSITTRSTHWRWLGLRVMWLSLCLGFMLFNAAQAQIQSPLPPLTPAQEKRHQALAKSLRCLVCQNQSVADSAAGLADDIKAQLRVLISQGQSDEQIIQYMVDRYGEFINYKPPLSGKTLVLWLGPALLLILMLVLLWRAIRRQSHGLSMKDSESAEE